MYRDRERESERSGEREMMRSENASLLVSRWFPLLMQAALDLLRGESELKIPTMYSLWRQRVKAHWSERNWKNKRSPVTGEGAVPSLLPSSQPCGLPALLSPRWSPAATMLQVNSGTSCCCCLSGFCSQAPPPLAHWGSEAEIKSFQEWKFYSEQVL